MIHFAQILLIKQVLTILIYARSEGSTLPILEYFPLGQGNHTKDQTNGVGKTKENNCRDVQKRSKLSVVGELAGTPNQKQNASVLIFSRYVTYICSV
jgi:hypothetical protein